jgi:hypothetical protein
LKLFQFPHGNDSLKSKTMNQEAPYGILREELWLPVNRLKAVEGDCSQIFHLLVYIYE